MSVQELEQAVAALRPSELKQFSEWFESYQEGLWDKQFETDVAAGRFDKLAKQADQDFEAGRCSEIFALVPRALHGDVR